MKICRVCKTVCDDYAELCPLCGAELRQEEIFGVENKESPKQKETRGINNPLLLASLEDVVSAEIFKDILTDNGIPFACGHPQQEGAMRVVFGGGFVSEDIYVDSCDFDGAKKLYTQFLDSESEFQCEFFSDEYSE